MKNKATDNRAVYLGLFLILGYVMSVLGITLQFGLGVGLICGGFSLMYLGYKVPSKKDTDHPPPKRSQI